MAWTGLVHRDPDKLPVQFPVPGQVIASEGEQKAARALKEAARVMASSPAALQLRCNKHSSH